MLQKDYSIIALLARNKIKDAELEHFQFEHEFNLFMNETARLKASHDREKNKVYEYVTYAQLLPFYQKTFSGCALCPSALLYRMKHLKQEEYGNDFLMLEDRTFGEPKYYINRLNKKLLMKIFMPHLQHDIQVLAEEIQMIEDNLHLLAEEEDEEK